MDEKWEAYNHATWMVQEPRTYHKRLINDNMSSIIINGLMPIYEHEHEHEHK
eukprot:gene6787-4869_t